MPPIRPPDTPNYAESRLRGVNLLERFGSNRDADGGRPGKERGEVLESAPAVHDRVSEGTAEAVKLARRCFLRSGAGVC